MKDPSLHPDEPEDDPYRRTYRCPACFDEIYVTLMIDWRQKIAAGTPAVEHRCERCGSLMELVGQPLDYRERYDNG
jgi:transcription elongation factor Elf1